MIPSPHATGWSIEDIVGVLTIITGWVTGLVTLLGFYIRALIAKNERHSTERHLQNLARFRWICVAFARMGYRNGEMPTFDDG